MFFWDEDAKRIHDILMRVIAIQNRIGDKDEQVFNNQVLPAFKNVDTRLEELYIRVGQIQDKLDLADERNMQYLNLLKGTFLQMCSKVSSDVEKLENKINLILIRVDDIKREKKSPPKKKKT